MTRRMRAALGLILLPALAAGCGTGVTAGTENPPARAATSGSLPSSASASRSARPATGAPLLKAPARPCRTLNARTRARIGMPKTRKDEHDTFDVTCHWTNDPGDNPPFTFRDLKVTYDAGIEGVMSLADQERAFERKRRDDYRQPSLFGGAPSVKGTIKQVGSVSAGKDFDEGYYVYFVYRIGEARRGEGRAVIRKRNVLITISVSGSDVPGRSMRESKPLPNAAAQRVLDAVADPLTAAVS
ncbi:DUF3558 family protein [Nonomuraea sp. NPDC050783]|uniref:DUF3558 family protein n=1 Tax=Nonomuraea sp. NPDC050783 TaxID=3154634 RepID=UPI003465D406